MTPWSTKPPRESGWYWRRYKQNPDIDGDPGIELVRLATHNGKLMWWCLWESDWLTVYDDGLIGWHPTPITPPEGWESTP